MAQEQWYMAIGGHQVGPVSQDDVITNLRNGTIDGNTLVFTEGMKNWTPLKDAPPMRDIYERFNPRELQARISSTTFFASACR